MNEFDALPLDVPGPESLDAPEQEAAVGVLTNYGAKELFDLKRALRESQERCESLEMACNSMTRSSIRDINSIRHLESSLKEANARATMLIKSHEDALCLIRLRFSDMLDDVTEISVDRDKWMHKAIDMKAGSC